MEKYLEGYHKLVCVEQRQILAYPNFVQDNPKIYGSNKMKEHVLLF